MMFFPTVLCPYEIQKEQIRIMNGLRGKFKQERKKPDRRFYIPEGWTDRDKMRQWFLERSFRELILNKEK